MQWLFQVSFWHKYSASFPFFIRNTWAQRLGWSSIFQFCNSSKMILVEAELNVVATKHSGQPTLLYVAMMSFICCPKYIFSLMELECSTKSLPAFTRRSSFSVFPASDSHFWTILQWGARKIIRCFWTNFNLSVSTLQFLVYDIFKNRRRPQRKVLIVIIY